MRQQLFTWWWSRIIEVIWEVIIPLASTGLLLYGGYRIISGELTLGDLMMFLVYLTMLLDPLATLAASAVSFQNNLAGLDRILDVLEIDEELPSRKRSDCAAQRRGARRDFDPRRLLRLSRQQTNRTEKRIAEHCAGSDRGAGRSQRSRQDNADKP